MGQIAMKIAVFGLGYVGLSNAVLLRQQNDVIAVDITAARVEILNMRKSPIPDAELEDFLAAKTLNLDATVDAQRALADANYVIVATPTNYDASAKMFDTSSVEAAIRTTVAVNRQATNVIKSIVPVGFVNTVRARLGTDQVISSPEILWQSRALYEKLHPSRINVGNR
jgi:UDPglucose 6-dehydrogenase